MDTEKYNLNGLATTCDVMPRTIRGYINQGLLPSCVGAGRGAHYDRRHLNRLRAIQRLQQGRADGKKTPTLKEIRRLLQQMSEDEIAQIAAGSPFTLVDTDDDDDPSDASATISPEHQAVLEALTQRAKPSPAATCRQTPIDSWSLRRDHSLMRIIDRIAGSTQEHRLAPADASRWTEFEISPDVILRVRSDLPDAQQFAYGQLASQLREALAGRAVEEPINESRPDGEQPSSP